MAAEHKENTIETIEVEWNPGETYKFTGVLRSHQDKVIKRVYLGSFQGAAPDGLELGKSYCLKAIMVNHGGGSDAPSYREFYDLLDYQGEHLRKILAKNYVAKKVENSLRAIGKPAVGVCVTVEPVYQPAQKLFVDLASKTVEERLDILLQFAQGCLELQSDENMVTGRRIVAHRDLKIDNGMLIEGESGFTVCLNDFASIRLEGDIVITEQPPQVEQDWSVDSTTPKLFSAGNTAPEDVLHRDGFRASEKTDVYALGMMLGNLFLKIDGKYNNPSIIWVKDQGWETIMPGFLEIMHEAFEKNRLVDEKAGWNDTWIEQALRGTAKNRVDGGSAKHTLRWETTANPQVQREIRQLFFDATRISPANRESLNKFIERLKQIQQMAKNSVDRLPVSIYLFDRSQIHLYKTHYVAAAMGAYAEECGAANLNGRAEPQVLCLSYAKGESGLAQLDDEALPVCDSKESLSRYIRLLSASPVVAGQNPLPYALANAADCLSDEADKYAFSGKLHIFAPSVPAYDDLAKIPLPSGALDLLGLCKVLVEELGVQPEIYFHAPANNRRHSNDPDWYVFSPLLQSIPYHTEDPGSTPESGTVFEPQPKRQSEQQTSAPPRNRADEFLTEAGAPYFVTRDGGKLYVGLKSGGK